MLYKYICSIISLNICHFSGSFIIPSVYNFYGLVAKNLARWFSAALLCANFFHQKVLQRPKQMIVRRCKVGALKLPNQVQSIFGESSKTCVAWHGRRETQRPFYWPIPSASFELLPVIWSIVESKVPNRPFDQVPEFHSRQFPSNPTIHSASPYWPSIRALQSFVSLHHASITIVCIWRSRILSIFRHPLLIS